MKILLTAIILSFSTANAIADGAKVLDYASVEKQLTEVLNYFRDGEALPSVTTEEVFHNAQFNTVQEITDFLLNAPEAKALADSGGFGYMDLRVALMRYPRTAK